MFITLLAVLEEALQDILEMEEMVDIVSFIVVHGFLQVHPDLAVVDLVE